jgi:hypothetical protein
MRALLPRNIGKVSIELTRLIGKLSGPELDSTSQ